jgi:hypothetical protein
LKKRKFPPLPRSPALELTENENKTAGTIFSFRLLTINFQPSTFRSHHHVADRADLLCHIAGLQRGHAGLQKDAASQIQGGTGLNRDYAGQPNGQVLPANHQFQFSAFRRGCSKP